jgi:hypothetical protein
MKSKNWKQVKGYEGLYEIHECGLVRSLDRLSNGKLRKGKSLKPFIRNGYYSVALSKNGHVKQFLLHRLLAEQFILNIDNKPTVNHINGDKLDNTIQNLEWATYSEQIQHAINILGFVPHKVVCVYDDKLRQIRKKARTGYIIPEHVKQKIKESLSQKVKCLTDNIEFDSIKAAVLYSQTSKTTFHRKLHNGELINGKKYELIHQMV